MREMWEGSDSKEIKMEEYICKWTLGEEVFFVVMEQYATSLMMGRAAQIAFAEEGVTIKARSLNGETYFLGEKDVFGTAEDAANAYAQKLLKNFRKTSQSKEI